MSSNTLKRNTSLIALLCLTVLTACGPTTTPEATTIVAPTPTHTSTSAPTGTLATTSTSPPTHTSTPARTSTYIPTPASLPPGLLVYPYLGNTTTDSVTISWVTDGSGASEVHYGAGSVVAATTYIYDGKYWHSATITGLAPDTTYTYQVYTAGHDLTPWPEVTFTTKPESHLFSFVVLGDGRPGNRSSPPSRAARDVAAQMAQHSFDLALHTGDIVHSGGVCSGDNSS